MKKYLKCFLSVIVLAFVVSIAGATTYDLTEGKGDSATINGADFIVFTDAMQTSVSAGTGVIDPFLTLQKNTFEESFNSDYFAVLDATRPQWNHSLQLADLIVYADKPGYYEFLLDINEPGGKGNMSLITLQSLMVYQLPNSSGANLFDELSDLSSYTPVWDLGAANDVILDYDIWQGSGQNMDLAVYIPTDLFGTTQNDWIVLYSSFGQSGGDGYVSEDGFEEWVLREGGTPIPEPATMLLLGTGLIGLAGVGRKKFNK